MVTEVRGCQVAVLRFGLSLTQKLSFVWPSLCLEMNVLQHLKMRIFQIKMQISGYS